MRRPRLWAASAAGAAAAGLAWSQVAVLQCEGPSMLPTINERGDRVLVERLSPRLVACRKGDLVIAQPPGEPRGIVCKRVVGVAGDLVPAEKVPAQDLVPGAWRRASATTADAIARARAGADDTLASHGVPMPNTAFAAPADHAVDAENAGPEKHYVQVPPGCVWLEGDNKPASSDSRLYGPVPAIAIKARVVARVWPLSQISILR